MDQVEALLFDVFGTTVDWRSSMERELQEFGQRKDIKEHVDWPNFANEWRQGYLRHTKRIAAGGEGTVNSDELHREYLDGMLKSPQWSDLAEYFKETDKQYLVGCWHTLGGWDDSVEGLQALKKQKIICALSNGNIRLLVDMAKYANLPWDLVLSTELFSTFKPDPKAYLSAAHHLSLPPSKCAMVASHLYDLEGAAAVGMKTIYVPRVGEDPELEARGEVVKSKDQGGEVDIVASSFVKIAEILGGKVQS